MAWRSHGKPRMGPNTLADEVSKQLQELFASRGSRKRQNKWDTANYSNWKQKSKKWTNACRTFYANNPSKSWCAFCAAHWSSPPPDPPGLE
eukprot:9064288-Prorocentrum_lima.AAC.1